MSLPYTLSSLGYSDACLYIQSLHESIYVCNVPQIHEDGTAFCFEEGKCTNSRVHEYKQLLIYIFTLQGITLSKCFAEFEEKEIYTATNMCEGQESSGLISNKSGLLQQIPCLVCNQDCDHVYCGCNCGMDIAYHIAPYSTKNHSPSIFLPLSQHHQQSHAVFGWAQIVSIHTLSPKHGDMPLINIFHKVVRN